MSKTYKIFGYDFHNGQLIVIIAVIIMILVAIGLGIAHIINAPQRAEWKRERSVEAAYENDDDDD